MKIEDNKIKEILVAGSYVSAEDLKQAEKNSKDSKITLVDSLYSLSFITKDLLGQAVADFHKVSYADLNSVQPDKETVLLLSEEIARKYNAVVFKVEKNELTVTTDNPAATGMKTEIDKVFSPKKVSIAYSLIEDIEPIFIFYQKPLDTRFEAILKKKGGVAPEIIDEILKDALIYKASDVHFEPQIDDVIIRFRVDGILHEAGHINKDAYENIINRIKVQASMKLDEHFKAQDGAIRATIDEKPVDLRVSIVPTINGEKIVIRILPEYVRGFSLSDVGMYLDDKEMIMKAISKPVGMIVIGGPTGSGKTTSLYSFLKTLNKPTRNITTIEDPIEYRVPGINQIQVDKDNDITFTTGLRSVVRQDPDIILVGEIRDRETAELSVNAALTGHLLLSTFHANDAETIIPRLIDMGAEPFLLASTIELVISQRLLRKVCQNCRYSYIDDVDRISKEIGINVKKHFGKKKKVTLYKGHGCHMCNGLGYQGRTSIFEIIPMTKELRELIIKSPSSMQIWELAKKQGAKSLFDSGMRKVKEGQSTLEELMRVAPPEEE